MRDAQRCAHASRRLRGSSNGPSIFLRNCAWIWACAIAVVAGVLLGIVAPTAQAAQSVPLDRLLGASDLPADLGPVALAGKPRRERPWSIELCRWPDADQVRWSATPELDRAVTVYPADYRLDGWHNPGAASGDRAGIGEAVYAFANGKLARQAWEQVLKAARRCEGQGSDAQGSVQVMQGSGAGTAWVISRFDYPGEDPQARQVMEAYALAGSSIVSVRMGSRVAQGSDWGLPLGREQVIALTRTLARRWAG